MGLSIVLGAVIARVGSTSVCILWSAASGALLRCASGADMGCARGSVAGDSLAAGTSNSHGNCVMPRSVF